MDSYEYYLLYHEQPAKFINDMSENNEEILIACWKLIENKKITNEAEVFSKICQLIQSAKSNDRLEHIFEALLISRERLESTVQAVAAKLHYSEDEQWLGVVRAIVKRAVKDEDLFKECSQATKDCFEKIAKRLVPLMYRDHQGQLCHVMSILNQMMEISDKLSDTILSSILNKSNERSDYSVLTCFFNKILERNVEFSPEQLLSSCFEDLQLRAMKQGLFFIKALVSHKRFGPEDEDSFKIFTIVLEALETSHLVKPTLNMIRSLRFSPRYSHFWFITIKMLIEHANVPVKVWGLNFLLSSCEARLDDQEMIAVLCALNSSCLYTDDENSLNADSLAKFIRINFDVVFRNLIEVNWVSVPFFKVLKIISDCKSTVEWDDLHIDVLLKQTEVVPKRVKNLVIRSGVQEEYIKIVTTIAQEKGVKPLLKVILNVFNIGDYYQGLEDCFQYATQSDYDALASGKYPDAFVKFALNKNLEVHPDLAENEQIAQWTSLDDETLTRITSEKIDKLSSESVKASELQTIVKLFGDLFIKRRIIPNLAQITDDFLKLIANAENKQDGLLSELATVVLSSIGTSKSDEFKSHVNPFFQKIIACDRSPRLIYAIIECITDFPSLVEKEPIRSLVKNILIETMIETNMLTKEQQIELKIGSEIESSRYENQPDDLSVSDKKQLRMVAALTLSTSFNSEWAQIVDDFMLEYARSSKKKCGYFPNAWIHRYKLHCLQPIVFCTEISKTTVDILVGELVSSNNQLSITYLIEIILAKHYPDVTGILKDKERVVKLKSPALKSIFAIVVLQLLSEVNFEIAEAKFDAVHDLILTYTMGQNYGVRSYAQAAIVVLNEHVKSLNGARESPVMARIARSCDTINESLQFKNAAKFFEHLRYDFRFNLKFDQIMSIASFYQQIPTVTNMPFEEIIEVDSDCESFKIAEIEISNHGTLVMEDQIAIPASQRESTSTNLQQKYIPFKYQVPGELADDSHTPRSSLTVVASLVSNAPNLGGLARTCEIFGVENYVIESLKLTENSEFKAVSKTAEKWMKISEVKPFQLFDYLLGMKLKGYSIVGAEQTAESVSIVDARMPMNAVLVLGNEKTGIPADLLALLDLTIEIPQMGQVRSLNVHVTGSILIWEYSKQHTHGIKLN